MKEIPKSRLERYSQPLTYDSPSPYLAPEESKKVVLSEDGKTLVEVAEIVVVDPRQRLSQFKPEDYNLQNLVALGLVDQLKTSQYVGNVDPAVVDFLENQGFTSEQLANVRDRLSNSDTIKFENENPS